MRLGPGVPPRPRPTVLARRVFRGTDAVAAGLLTRDELRSRQWRRLFRDVYADADLVDSHDLRVAGAALLVPPTAVFSGRTAAHLWGVAGLADAETPVEVTVPPASRFGPVAGIRVRQARLEAREVTTRRDHRCTAKVRTALDVARLELLMESVPVLDVLLARCIVRVEDLREAVGRLPTGRGVRRARQAVALADGRAESPQESRLRVLLQLAGLTPVPQWRVHRPDGVFIARVDLAWPEQRLAVEYDGEWHARPGQLARDRRRLNALVAAGWRVLHVTAADLYRPETLIARIRALLAAEIGVLGR